MCIRTPLVHTVEQQSIFLVHFCPSPKQAAEGDVVVVVVAVRAAEAEADKAPKTVANLKKSILFTIEIVDDKGMVEEMLNVLTSYTVLAHLFKLVSVDVRWGL